MKRLKFKSKLFFILCIPVICAVVSCSLFLGKTPKDSQASANYVDSNTYISELMNQNSALDSAYSLNSYYPIFPENQTDSNLCWIYSSLKVLETSLMKQRNEFHNFSEIGAALLNYIKYTMPNSNIDPEMKLIDRASHFAQFNLIAQDYGLIYENILSNDVYYDVDESNVYLYNEMLDKIDTSIMENISAINISEDNSFIMSNRNKKIEILKRYVSTYGGIFAGIERGIISNVDNVYYKTNANSNNKVDGFVGMNHAACIIGWNDNKDCGSEGTGAFYALNSWGVNSNSYSYFYIPYSYANLYDDLYGYICLEENDNDYELVSTTAGGEDGFAARYMNASSLNPNNLFLYGENFEMNYKISDKYNFDSIFVNIYQGMSNVTSDFTLEFDEVNRLVKITLDNYDISGEGYYIEFYDDLTYLGKEDFYIFTGTEVSYIEFKSNSTKSDSNTVLFSNNFASNTFSQTYYLYDSEVYNYYLDFYLPGLSGYNYNKVRLSVDNVYITSTDENGNVVKRPAEESDFVSVVLESNQQTIQNRCRVKIVELIRKNTGKMVEFNVNLTSLLYDPYDSEKLIGTGKTSVYNFKIFVSSYHHAETNMSNKIIYSLDGGVNNPENINRYPSFDNEIAAMTSFELLEPTKKNSTFIGWYLDKNYTVEISKIDSNISKLLGKEFDDKTNQYISTLLGYKYSDDIILYARWEEIDFNFFEGKLNITDILDYDGNEKDIDSKIIYGDSVISLFEFLPELDNLKNYKYFANYTYWFNGKVIDTNNLNPNGEEIVVANNFLNNSNVPTLVCGDYEIKFNIFMVVSHQFSISRDYYVRFSVDKKEITATFDENTLNYVYDTKEHKPSVISLNGTYPEDGVIDYVLDNGAVKNYGEYTYNLVSINNNNYVIAPNQSCTMYISKSDITIEWLNTTVTYNGNIQEPFYKINGILGNDNIEAYYGLKEDISVVPELKNAGVYSLSVRRISNSNYQLIGDTDCVFTINKANIKIVFDNVEVRLSLAPLNRPKISYNIEGTLYDSKASLGITCDSEGSRALDSGNYVITGTCNNPNYEVEIVEGTYKVLGFYYIFYTLPDGSEYKEAVEDGQEPKGIPSDVLKAPLFHKIVYSDSLAGNGSTDLYITVSYKNYTWIVLLVGVVLCLFVLYRLSTRKSRRNRTR